jgi:uncharacterized phage protein (TIGR02216 family)
LKSAPPEDEGGGAATAGFPWDEAMAAGFGLLRLSPDAFWRMTPREFERAIRPFVRDGRDAPSRTALDALLRRFPD